MIFDTTSDSIILISYPSGGFGNFIYYVLTEFADNTVKVNTSAFNFSSLGDSHSVPKYTNDYYHEPDNYDPTIDINPQDKKILVLCDNGINNDSYTKIIKTFPNAVIIRLVIDNAVRPVIYQTCIYKALRKDSMLDETKDHINSNWSDANEAYAHRENFTLMYHSWSYGWNINSNVINISIESLVINPIKAISQLINDLGMNVINLKQLTLVTNDWLSANKKYFDVYYNAKNIMQAILENKDIDISNITNLHEQGYINYCIEEHFNVIIPVYDYKDWFKSTNEITNMIEKLCSE